METLKFIMVFYLIVSYIVFSVTFYRNYDFYKRLSKKRTDETNKELDKEMERGEITPMERDAKLESYTGGFISFFIIQLIKAPIDTPVFLFAILFDVDFNDEKVSDE